MPFLSDASARVIAAIVPDPAPDCVAAWIAADTSASTASDVAAADSLATHRLGFLAAFTSAASSSSSASSSSPSARRPRATTTPPTSPFAGEVLAENPRRDRLPRPRPAGLFRSFPPSAVFPRRSSPLPKMSDRSTCDACPALEAVASSRGVASSSSSTSSMDRWGCVDGAVAHAKGNASSSKGISWKRVWSAPAGSSAGWRLSYQPAPSRLSWGPPSASPTPFAPTDHLRTISSRSACDGDWRTERLVEPLDPSSEHRRWTQRPAGDPPGAVASASSGLLARPSIPPEVLLDVDALGRRGGVGSAGSG